MELVDFTMNVKEDTILNRKNPQSDCLQMQLSQMRKYSLS